MFAKVLGVGFGALVLSGCMTLHRTSIGDISSGGSRFVIEITDIGINMENTSKAVGRVSGKKDEAETVKNIIGLFQWGPRTGNPVYNIGLWNGLAAKILEKCPKGEIHSLVSNREFRNFYYGSAEGVRITGYCLGENR